MTHLLIATTNRGKLREITGLLSDAPFEIVTLVEWPDRRHRRKRVARSNRTLGRKRCITLMQPVTDCRGGFGTGDRRPRRSAGCSRPGGAGRTTYPQKFALIYEALRAKGAVDSPARFVCALALVQGGEVLFETRGTVEGQIAREPKRGGWLRIRPDLFLPAARADAGGSGRREGGDQPSRGGISAAPRVSAQRQP